MRPLALNFCHDFLPERNYLSRLVEFAESAPSGTKLDISKATGIPTGASSGKVEPIVHYATAMGLVLSEKNGEQWHLQLTPAGKLIRQEDPYLNEPVTQWFAHLMLSRRAGLTQPAIGVADAWFTFYGDWTSRLSAQFSVTTFVDLLAEKYGQKGYLKGLVGLVIRTYTESTCLGQVKAFRQADSGELFRLPSPVDKSFFPSYAVYFYLLWDELFPYENQMSLDDVLTQSRFQTIMSWEQKHLEVWLQWLVAERLIQLDRQTGQALVLRLQTTEYVISNMYSELL